MARENVPCGDAGKHITSLSLQDNDMVGTLANELAILTEEGIFSYAFRKQRPRGHHSNALWAADQSRDSAVA